MNFLFVHIKVDNIVPPKRSSLIGERNFNIQPRLSDSLIKERYILDLHKSSLIYVKCIDIATNYRNIFNITPLTFIIKHIDGKYYSRYFKEELDINQVDELIKFKFLIEISSV